MSESQKMILITGGAGFVGSNLCERLVAEGYRVISLDNYFTGSTDNHIDGVEYREGHTKDIARLVPETPDLLYHLGEYSRTEQSHFEPEIVFELNTVGTFSVLEFVREKKCKLIYAGSSTKFADGGLGRDQSPYAFTKATNTELVRNYGTWYGINYAITYFYNVYGNREIASGPYATVIARFIDRYKKGEPLTVTAPGTQKRIFTHVDDIVDGLIVVGEKGMGDEFGLGAAESYSILDIAEMFNVPIEMTPEKAGNRMNAVLDTAKSNAIGWHAQKKVEDYIRAVISA